jgi:hypothetical protein
MRVSSALLTILFYVLQQSPQPTPRPAEQTHKPEQISSSEQEHRADNQNPCKSLATVSQVDTVTNQNGTNAGSNNETNSAAADKWITWFTGVLAIVAILQLGILGLQFWAAHRQAEYLRSAERAHIDLDFTGNKEVFTVMIANYGKSVANIVEYRFSHAIYALDVTDLSTENAKTIFEDTLPMNQVLPPSSPKEFWSFDIKNFFTEETIKNDPRIVLRGLLVYLDIFGEAHETEVLFESHGPTLKNLPEYNRYT